MFSFEQLDTIQVEITNRCQASCPMCIRNIHGGITNPSLLLTDWSLEQFKGIFNREILAKISSINFCGNYGDPIINNSLIDMCQYASSTNPSIEIIISTNGSAHSVEWWQRLARVLPKKHKVIFAIDGLKETHKIYRIGTSYDMIIRNAKAFIKSGGIAHWMFIRFRHNEHEVDTARSIANEFGFAAFTLKDSKRFGKQFPVLNRQGNIVYHIEPPSNSKIKPVEFVDLKDYKQWKNDISCFTFDTKELFIDANGYLMPCCLISSFLYANYDVELYNTYKVIDETSIVGIAREVQLEVFSIIQELGGLDSLDARKYSIKEIMSTEIWQTLLHKKWGEKSSSACKILCGQDGPFIKINEQLNRTS
jgi:MoaA/NifB/PqqE/SkfB family radical SAM enzyme